MSDTNTAEKEVIDFSKPLGDFEASEGVVDDSYAEDALTWLEIVALVTKDVSDEALDQIPPSDAVDEVVYGVGDDSHDRQ